MSESQFAQFRDNLEQRLQEGNQKWDAMQTQISEANMKWERADAATTQSWKIMNDRIEQMEVIMQSVKDTMDHLGSTVRENADQVQFLHGDFTAKFTAIDEQLRQYNDKWREADLKYVQDMNRVNERMANISHTSTSAGGSNYKVQTLIDPKFLVINQFAGNAANRGEFDSWRDGLEIFWNKIFPNIKPILHQIRKATDEVDNLVFATAAKDAGISIPSLEWSFNTVDFETKVFLNTEITGDAAKTVRGACGGLEMYRLLCFEYDRYNKDTKAIMSAELAKFIGQPSKNL